MSSNKEREDECSPGMKLDDGKCIPMSDKTSDTKSEDDNAGMVADVGTKTLDTANPTDVPAADHECPDGTPRICVASTPASQLFARGALRQDYRSPARTSTVKHPRTASAEGSPVNALSFFDRRCG